MAIRCFAAVLFAAQLALTTTWGPAAAAVPDQTPNATPVAACAGAPCRSGPVHMTLLAGDGQHEYALEFDTVPYIKDGTITILPGEALVFRFSPTADGPGVPVFVGILPPFVPHHLATDDSGTKVTRDPTTGETYSVIHSGSALLDNGTADDHLKDQPPGTMIVSYNQLAGRPNMLLVVEHNLPLALKYDATINLLRPDGNQISKPTTTCPALRVFQATETWPDPIGVITLRNFRYVDVSQGLDCR